MAVTSFLDRVLPRRVGTRRFAAVASPQGLHVVEYGRERGGLSLRGGIRQPEPGDDPASLAAALADAIESLGGRGGELVLALGGYGTAHHILTLPYADDEILRPIVGRELRRYYPNLDDPVVDFVPGAHVEGSSPRKQEVLVGAVPYPLAVDLSRALAARKVELHHLTVQPAVLQTLYDTFDGALTPAVMVLLMEAGLLIGCFHHGALRLFIEPPQDVHGRPLRDPEAVTEQVQRANLFLRQQFPNAGVSRVLLAAPDGEYEAVASMLRAELESDVVRMADTPAGSLAALGAALDADTRRPLRLLPPEVRPRTGAERWTRRLAAAAAGIVMAAAVWWAGAAMTVARVEADRARTVESRVRTELAWLNSVERTLETRRAHELRLEFVEATTAERAETRRILAAVAAAAPPPVRLDTLRVERQAGAWALTLTGRAAAGTSADAVRAVDALYRGIPERLPVRELELDELRDVQEAEGDTTIATGGAPVAIGFHMSFIVQWTDSQR
ncbi:MAG: hypothetical protein R6U63_00100 [Longimicrobiales bacterium]